MTAADVALVSPYPGLGDDAALPSGVAAYTERLSSALAGDGMAVRVLAPEVEGEPAFATVGDVTVERPYRRGPTALMAASAAARRTRAPVVHLQFETFLYGGPASVPGVAPALANLRHAGQGPVVTLHQVVDPAAVDRDFTRVHRVQVPHQVARLGLSALQRTVRSLAAATVVHERSFERLVPGAEVVPVGLDPVEARSPEDGRSTKRALGLDPGRLTVLCFGFVSPYKGLEHALAAARIAGDKVQLVVAGGVHPRLDGRDDYAGDLRRDHADIARFPGYVAEADVRDWFRAADVLLLPYPRPFASSGPLAQALGFGTPVLCSEPLGRCVGASPALVTSIDPPRLAARLAALADEPGALASLGEATRGLAAGRPGPRWRDATSISTGR